MVLGFRENFPVSYAWYRLGQFIRGFAGSFIILIFMKDFSRGICSICQRFDRDEVARVSSIVDLLLARIFFSCPFSYLNMYLLIIKK